MSSLNLLLVSNDSHALQTLRLAAESAGAPVTTANPMELLLKLEQGDFGGIILAMSKANLEQFMVLQSLEGRRNGAQVWAYNDDNMDDATVTEVPTVTSPARLIEQVIAQLSTMPNADEPKQKVLIVEDNEKIVELYKIAFESEGYEVCTALNGIDGITAAVTFKPSLILLDIMMPQMDGYEVIQAMRQNSNLKSTIVVFTNLEQKEAEEKAQKMGADYFLRKSQHTPFAVVEMVKAGEFAPKK